VVFDKEYSFQGKHAEMVTSLTNAFGQGNHKFFEHNYDVYILAPIIGFLYHSTAELDRSSEIKPTKIFAGQLFSNRDALVFNYRLIMLLDSQYEPDSEKRIEKAFRGQETTEDIERFESYVRGGVEKLYEKLILDCTTEDDYIAHLYDFLDEFNDRYNQTIVMDHILELCRKIK